MPEREAGLVQRRLGLGAAQPGAEPRGHRDRIDVHVPQRRQVERDEAFEGSALGGDARRRRSCPRRRGRPRPVRPSTPPGPPRPRRHPGARRRRRAPGRSGCPRIRIRSGYPLPAEWRIRSSSLALTQSRPPAAAITESGIGAACGKIDGPRSARAAGALRIRSARRASLASPGRARAPGPPHPSGRRPDRAAAGRGVGVMRSRDR